jgi:hypothetical protein
LISTYSVGVMQPGSSCGQPGEENSSIAANKWLMLIASPPAASLSTILYYFGRDCRFSNSFNLSPNRRFVCGETATTLHDNCRDDSLGLRGLGSGKVPQRGLELPMGVVEELLCGFEVTAVEQQDGNLNASVCTR